MVGHPTHERAEERFDLARRVSSLFEVFACRTLPPPQVFPVGGKVPDRCLHLPCGQWHAALGTVSPTATRHDYLLFLSYLLFLWYLLPLWSRRGPAVQTVAVSHRSPSGPVVSDVDGMIERWPAVVLSFRRGAAGGCSSAAS